MAPDSPDRGGASMAVSLNGVAPDFAVPADEALSPIGQVLATIAEYSRVRAGTITANGESIEIDPATMTLREAIDAIDRLADVSASLDETSGRITIATRRTSSPLAIADASLLLDTVGIADGSYGPDLDRATSSGLALANQLRADLSALLADPKTF